MIRRANECRVENREHVRDGNGTVIFTHFIDGPAELNDKGRLFSRLTLEPGSSIGFHIHDKDAELFYFLRGTGEYSDNGEICTVTAGDVAVCPTGTGHSIANKGDEVLEFIAVVIYK